MGGAQASLCSCWERQKLPTDFPPPPPPPTRTHEPSARAAAADSGEDEEEVDFDLRTANTFLEYHQVARVKKRSRSVPKSMRPCRVETVIPAAAGNMEETAHDKVSRVAELPPLDDRFEPFLTPEMVSAERRWKREVLGRLAWRNVPARPHSCANTCTQCCQLFNDSWRLAACAAARIPGQADPCRALEILPLLPEEEDDE